MRADDAPAVLEAFRGAGMDRQGEVTTPDQAREWVGRMLPGEEDRVVFAIDVDGTMVGCIGIGPIDRANRTGWFWYWTREDQRGRGLTSRAAATAATWALTDGGLDRLELGHRANNPESGGVARAAGFVQEGVERGKFLVEGVRVDVLTYGRLATDPAPTVAPLPVDR
ncbi:GNAT family N-acetyltransferase [Ornithinicoccus hortensis]|uniref:RimJ/RimL family protein N-acetyltransferase n=1 Tax=Ornithinicoccus hortensis TaxID=82346 RepID=A0A542YPQ3_9MICO|nr:GNAT family protein [Ornithinicoccus hortensis]TQL50075.1 RimJ/RimL family protein N-acetyltransferase [Ornithinicoccus hortensis]